MSQKLSVGVTSLRWHEIPYILSKRDQIHGRLKAKKVRRKIVLTVESALQVLEAAVDNLHISVREISRNTISMRSVHRTLLKYKFHPKFNCTKNWNLNILKPVRISAMGQSTKSPRNKDHVKSLKICQGKNHFNATSIEIELVDNANTKSLSGKDSWC